jgi:hypothetical protein
VKSIARSVRAPIKACLVKDDQGPQGCPTQNQKEILDEVMKRYDRPEIREFARQASIQGEGIPISPFEKSAFENDGLFYMEKEKGRKK